MYQYRWRKVWDCGSKEADGSFSGHTVFRDELSGLLAIADMSGDTPDQTDDGVLWIDGSREIRLFVLEVGGVAKRVYASLPLVTAVDSSPRVETATICAIQKLSRLVRLINDDQEEPVKVSTTPEVKKLMAELSEIVCAVDDLTGDWNKAFSY